MEQLDDYTFGKIMYMLPYVDILSLSFTCKTLQNKIKLFLSNVRSIRGCVSHLRQYTDKNQSKCISEIQLIPENDDEKICYNIPNTVKRIYVVDEQYGAECNIKLPENLKIFHSHGLFYTNGNASDDGTINCPELEEFTCCETSSSPPPYSFEHSNKLSRLVTDRCGDNGENPMRSIYKTPLECLHLMTASDRSLKRLHSLKYLGDCQLDGTCFSSLKQLEYLYFYPKKTIIPNNFKYLTNLKYLGIMYDPPCSDDELHSESDYSNSDSDSGSNSDSESDSSSSKIYSILNCTDPKLEYLHIDCEYIKTLNEHELIELSTLIVTRFTYIKKIWVTHYLNPDKNYTFDDTDGLFIRIHEHNRKIQCNYEDFDQIIDKIINKFISVPNSETLVLCQQKIDQ